MTYFKKRTGKILSVLLSAVFAVPFTAASLSVSAEQYEPFSKGSFNDRSGDIPMTDKDVDGVYEAGIANTGFVNTSELSREKVTCGEQTVISCSSLNGEGVTEYKVLYKEPESTSWKTISAYSPTEKVSFRPAKEGEYTIRIRAKDAKGNTEAKDMTLTSEPAPDAGQEKYIFFDNSKTQFGSVYVYCVTKKKDNYSYNIITDEFGDPYSDGNKYVRSVSLKEKYYSGCFRMNKMPDSDIWQAKIPYNTETIVFTDGTSDEMVKEGKLSYSTAELSFDPQDMAGKIYRPSGKVSREESIAMQYIVYADGSWEGCDGLFRVVHDEECNYLFFDNSQMHWENVYAHWYSYDGLPAYDKAGEPYGCIYDEESRKYLYRDYPGTKMQRIGGTDIWQIELPRTGNNRKEKYDIYFTDGGNYLDGEKAGRTAPRSFASQVNGGYICEPDVSEYQMGKGAEKTLFIYPDCEWKPYSGKYTADTKLLNISKLDFSQKLEHELLVGQSGVITDVEIMIDCLSTGGRGEIQYAVLYQEPGRTNWKTLQSYSARRYVPFTPVRIGKYTLRTKAKDAYGQVSVKDFVFETKDIVPYNDSSISSGRISLGSTVKITCSSYYITNDIKHAVMYRKENETEWKMLSDYSDKTTVLFTPETEGSYIIRVVAKTGHNTISGKRFALKVTAYAPTNTSWLSASGIILGDAVTVNCSANGGNGKKQFKVMYKPENQSAWITLSEYSDASAVSFMPAAAGRYTIRIIARDTLGKTSEKSYTLQVKKPLRNCSVLGADEIRLGKSVMVFCLGEGGTGNYTYAVYYKKSTSSKWSKLRGYDTSNIVPLKPGAAVSYDVRVDVRDSSGKTVSSVFLLTVTK